MNYLLAKVFNNAEYAKGFLSGKIYMNLLSTFGIGNLLVPKEDIKNKYRGDLNEGLARQILVMNGDYRNTTPFFRGQDDLPDDITSVGELDSKFLDENALSLFSLYFDSERETFAQPDPRMIDFGINKETKEVGPTVIITQPREFLSRIVSTISRNMESPFWLAYGLVDYTLSNNSHEECDEFRKSKKYAWQQEFRIAVDVGGPTFYVRSNEIGYDPETGAIIIDIGDMSDIAMIVSTDAFLSLDFTKADYDMMARNLAPICPFYPPVKNKTTFACPVFKSGTTIHLSRNSLYPIIRDSRNYKINVLFAEKSNEMIPAMDSCFLNVICCYFSRLLSLYMVPNHQEELSSLIPAIYQYLRMLHIEDIGMRLLCQSLLNKDSNVSSIEVQHHVITKKSFGPNNTDYAELVLISGGGISGKCELNGNRYVRLVPDQDAVLSSGRRVKKGEGVWVSVSKIKWFEISE